MKHIFLIALVALSFFLVSCNKTTLVGKWQNADIQTGGFLEFTSDGHFILYSKGNKPRRGTYTTDDSKSPKYLDLNMDANNVNPDRKGKSFSAAGIYKIEEGSGSFGSVQQLTLKSANDVDVGSIHPDDFSPSAGYLDMKYERFDGSIPPEYETESLSPAQIESQRK